MYINPRGYQTVELASFQHTFELVSQVSDFFFETTLTPGFIIHCLFLVEIGEYVHPCQDDMVVKGTNDKIPYFNAPIFLQNKEQIGKVDEIFGHLTEYVSFYKCVLCFHFALSKMCSDWTYFGLLTKWVILPF